MSGRLLRPAAASVRVRLEVGLRWCGSSWTCAPEGPRPGGWDRRRLGFSGCGSRRTQESAFLPPERWVSTESSSAVDLPPSEGCTGGESTAERVRGGSASPFSWHGPRGGRSAAHPTPKSTHDSSFARRRSNASAFTTASRRKRSILGPSTLERRFLRPTRTAVREPEPPPLPAVGRGPLGDHTQHQPMQRTSGQDQPRQRTSGQDQPRQRTSKVATPEAAHQQAQTPTRNTP